MAARSGSPALPRRVLGEAAVAAALFGLAFLLYGRAAGLGGPGFWWSDDDSFNLQFLATFGPAEIALDPAVWQRLPFRMLTPLLFLSLQLDAALWGLAPAAFYLHQVAALGLAGAALYAVLRLWLPLPWSAGGAALFLLGPPVASLVPLLAVRHYVEALLLGLLATAAFVIAVRRKSIRWSLASAILGFVAMTAKEIAVPLPALLVLLPAGTFRERLRAALPHAAALALYLVYRLWMLDTLVGGYGFVVLPGSWPELLFSLPGKAAAQIAGGATRGPAGWALLAVWLAALVLAAALPGRADAGHPPRILPPLPPGLRAIGLTAAGLLLALLPVLPVSHEVAPRYALPVWLVVAVSLVAAGCRLAGDDGRPALAAPLTAATGTGAGHAASAVARPSAAGLAGMLPSPPGGRAVGPVRRLRQAAALGLAATALGSAGLAHRAAWAAEVARAGRKAAENRFALRMAPADLLRAPLDRPASLRGLGWLRERQLGLPPAGGWFYDDLYLSSPAAAGKRAWGYDPAAGRVVEVTGRIPALRSRHRAAWRQDAALAATFTALGASGASGAAVLWELGPYPDRGGGDGGDGGGYALVFGDGLEVNEVPRRAGFQRRVGKTTLRVRYTAPAGWVTYSPELVLDFAARPAIRWSRPAPP